MDYKVYVDQDLEFLIPEFMENRLEEIERLKELLAEGDFERIKELGHALKGTGGGYGFHVITELGAEIEKSAQEEDEAQTKELVAKLADYLENAEIIYE